MAENDQGKLFYLQFFIRNRFLVALHSVLDVTNILVLLITASPERIDQNDKIMPSAINSGTQLQQQMHHEERSNEECGIRDVWRHNLEEEFVLIRKVVNKYCYVAMDTEFPGKSSSLCIVSQFKSFVLPGVVARPIGEFRSTADYQYQLLRCNVDLLKIIQLGLTFMDEDGNTAPEFSTWQFNFKFSLT